MRRLMLPVLLALLLPLGACAGRDLGLGINSIEREYGRPSPEVWQAVQDSAQDADLAVTSDRHDNLGGELIAVRANGSEVRIRASSLDPSRTRVSVRVEPGDRDLAGVVHERIAGNLGMGTARAAFFGGNAVRESYAADMTACRSWARRALAELHVTLTMDEPRTATAMVDGRLQDSTPVRIRMKKVDQTRTEVTFIAGNEETEDNRAFAQKMKEQFEAMERTASVDR